MKAHLDLNPSQNSHVSNIAKQAGLLLHNNSILKTDGENRELVNYFKNTDQLTIAVWIKPANLKLSGPARIVSMSTDPSSRNFTLGQERSRLNFRVRTPLTGLNGAKVSLTSQPILSTNQSQFIVTTYNRGEAKLYYNGKWTATKLYDTSFYLPLLINLEKTKHRIIDFCYILLFPLGWLSWNLTTFKLWEKIASSFIILVPFIISSLFKLIILHHTIDLHLCLISCVIIFLVLISGLFG